jgi:hypothetical protein
LHNQEASKASQQGKYISCLTNVQGLMSKRSNQLPDTLVVSKAENAESLIRTGSANFIIGAY